jgi:hypothetical protein
MAGSPVVVSTGRTHERPRQVESISQNARAFDGAGVAGQAGQDVAEALTVVEGERQPEQPGEQVSTEGREEALGEDGGRHVVGVRESRAEQVQAHVRERDPGEGPQIARNEHVVDQPLVEADLDRLDGGGDGDEQQADHEPTAVRSGVGPEAGEQFRHRHRRGGRHDRESFPERVERSQPPAGATRVAAPHACRPRAPLRGVPGLRGGTSHDVSPRCATATCCYADADGADADDRRRWSSRAKLTCARAARR